MGTIKFDERGITSTVTLLINRANTSLETARGIISGIKVPSDFSKAGIIRGATRGIYEIKSSLKSANNQMTATVKRFKASERQSEIDVNALLSSLGTHGSYMDPKESAKTTRQATASIANAFLGLTRGMGIAGEAMVDTGAIAITNMACAITISDPSRREDLRKETMSFVAKEYVNNAYTNFYNTKTGKWINTNAAETLKTGGAAYQVLESLGYIAGLTGATAVTGFTTGLSGAGAFATMSGIAAFGRETGAYWTNAKTAAKGTGKDWRTKEVYNKGIKYGSASAAWEALQAYMGAKIIPGINVSSTSEATNMFTRVAADSVFNAADIPFRALVTTKVEEGINTPLNIDRFKIEFEKQGGWAAVGINTSTGAIGSLFGEFTDYGHGRTQTNNINRNNTYTDGWFNRMSRRTKRYGVDQGVFKYLDWTEHKYYKYLKEKCMKEYGLSARDAVKLMRTVDAVGACSYADRANNLICLFRNNQEEFEDLFGFPLYRNSTTTGTGINDAELLLDMYFVINHRENGGNIIVKRGRKNVLLDIDPTTKKRIKPKDLAEKQRYLSRADDGVYGTGLDVEYVRKKTNGEKDLFYYQLYNTSEDYYNDPRNMEEVRENVKYYMDQGQELSIGVDPRRKGVQLLDPDTKKRIGAPIKSGHAMKIMNVTDEGLIVCSWGKRCLLTFEDLEKVYHYDIGMTSLLFE